MKDLGPEPKLFHGWGVCIPTLHRTGLEKLDFAMKTIPVSLVVVGLILPAVCLAEPKGGPSDSERGDKGQPRHGPGAFMEAWGEADANHDGFISKAEFESMPRVQKIPEEKRGNLFKRLDKDADGKLAKEEIGRLGRGQDGQGPPPMKRFWELDTDKSGGISLEEFRKGEFFSKLPPEKQEEVFRRLDTNGDGAITSQDRPEPPFKRGRHHDDRKGPNGPERVNAKLDTNGDGALSFDEFRLGPAVKDLTEDQQEDRFELLDRNHDKKISPEDFPAPPPEKPQD